MQVTVVVVVHSVAVVVTTGSPITAEAAALAVSCSAGEMRSSRVGVRAAATRKQELAQQLQESNRLARIRSR